MSFEDELKKKAKEFWYKDWRLCDAFEAGAKWAKDWIEKEQRKGMCSPRVVIKGED